MVYLPTGSNRALATFDLVAPEYPRVTPRRRRAVRVPMEGGASQARQTALSLAETSAKSEVRTWHLYWNNATEAETARARDLTEATRGGGLLLYYPPEAGDDGSNIAPTPERLTSLEWQKTTAETVTTPDSTTVPTGVSGTATLLTNATGATVPAKISASVSPFPAAGSVMIFSCWVRRPSSNPGTRFTLKLSNPNNGNEHFITWAWGGASWTPGNASPGAPPYDGTQGVDVSQAPWYRFAYGSFAGGQVSAWPGRRVLSIENGSSGTPSANTGLIVTGAMLEEARSFSDASSFGQAVTIPGGPAFTLADYVGHRRHVYVEMEPAQISRKSGLHSRMAITLREVISAA